MSLQERVKEIIHRWKFTCTIPNEDFDEVIDIVHEYYVYKDSDITMIGSAHESDIRADEREQLIKQGQCKDCPHKIGDITERDCCFPDCVGGWEAAYKAKCAELADERERCVKGYEEIREIYAGMDGFIPETAPEGYQQRIIKQMYDAAIEAIKAE